MDEGIIIVDFKTRKILEANIAAEKMFKCSRDDLVGSSTRMLHLNENMYEKFGGMILSSYRENGCFDATFELKRKDGTTFPTEHSILPIMAEDGSYLRHVSVIRDVTERVKAHEKVRYVKNTLEEKNQFLESVITNMFSGIVVVDNHLRIKMANPYALRLCSRIAEQVVGCQLRDFCPEFEEHLTAGIGSGEITAHFCSNEYVVGFSLFNQTGTENKTVGHIINFKDLTEIMKIRNEIRQKERLSAMGEVVARVAHEMRNPLCAMTAVVQILGMELTLSPQHGQLMDSYMGESKRLNNLVGELLDCTRELRVEKKKVDLCSIIDRATQVNEPYLAEKNLRIFTSYAFDELFLMGDSEKLEQVAINLVKNAIDASDYGGKIDIILESNNNEAKLSVVDTGHGIASGQLEKIFEIFYTTKKHGTGMGLAISKNIVEAHKGSLVACNNREGGATFTMTLPLSGPVV